MPKEKNMTKIVLEDGSEIERFDIGGYMRGLSAEERQERARKAGVASGAARRVHRPMRDVLKQLMALECTDEGMRSLLIACGLEPTNDNAVSMAQIIKSVKDKETEAARFIRDTLGEKPREAYDLAMTKPIQAMDLGKMSDEELAALADKADD